MFKLVITFIIMLLIAVVADIVLWFFKYSSFCNDNTSFLNFYDNKIFKVNRIPPPRVNSNSSSTFLVLSIVGLVSIFVSVNYVEVSSFIKSYLTEAQIQFVRDFVSNITNGSGVAVFVQTITSQIVVALSISTLAYSLRAITYYINFVFKKVSYLISIKLKSISSFVSLTKRNLQFSRFNQ